MSIEETLSESCVIAYVQGRTKKEVLIELIEVLKKAQLIENTEQVLHVILERERLGSTGIGDGVAIPHGKMKGIHTILCAFGRSVGGVDFDALDRKPVHIFFLLLAPEDSASLHLKMLSRISKMLRDPFLRKKLLEATDSHALYLNIIEEDRKV